MALVMSTRTTASPQSGGGILDNSLLVRWFGFRATLVHGDTLLLDRWMWLSKRLPETRNKERLLDVGCGTGAFSIGAALRGYETLGLSWDTRNQETAAIRADLCNAKTAKFELLDVRSLASREDLMGVFDVAVCCENVEHIIDDKKLIRDISACLKPGGRLLLTTPYQLYRAIGDVKSEASDRGPFRLEEDGAHVRRGYSKAMLFELCRLSGLEIEKISSCSGFLSQKITFIFRFLSHYHSLLGWGLTLPFRVLPLIFDRLIVQIFGWPDYCICLEAYKPRYPAKLCEEDISGPVECGFISELK